MQALAARAVAVFGLTLEQATAACTCDAACAIVEDPEIGTLELLTQSDANHVGLAIRSGNIVLNRAKASRA